MQSFTGCRWQTWISFLVVMVTAPPAYLFGIPKPRVGWLRIKDNMPMGQCFVHTGRLAKTLCVILCNFRRPHVINFQQSSTQHLWEGFKFESNVCAAIIIIYHQNSKEMGTWTISVHPYSPDSPVAFMASSDTHDVVVSFYSRWVDVLMWW